MHIVHISRGFEGDIPEYQPRGDTKALADYVTRCRRHKVRFIYDLMYYAESHNIPGLLILIDFEKA